MMIGAAFTSRLGKGGILSVSTVSALFDVDVSVLSSHRLLGHSASAEIVTTAILMALVSNAVGRLGPAVIASPIAY